MRATAGVVVVGIVLASSVGVGGPAGATRKKIKPCALLSVAEVDGIVAGEPISDATETRERYAAICDYTIGGGPGLPGGGLVTIQVYTGRSGKEILKEAKKGDRVGAAYWNPTGQFATGGKKGIVVVASVTVPGTTRADHRDEALALVNKALGNV
jgi:hypothetical protein